MTLLTQARNAGLAQRLDALDLQVRDDLRATLLQSGDQHEKTHAHEATPRM